MVFHKFFHFWYLMQFVFFFWNNVNVLFRVFHVRFFHVARCKLRDSIVLIIRNVTRVPRHFHISDKYLHQEFINYQLTLKMKSENRFLPQKPKTNKQKITPLPFIVCKSQSLCEKLENCHKSRGTYAVAENIHITN